MTYDHRVRICKSMEYIAHFNLTLNVRHFIFQRQVLYPEYFVLGVF